MGTDIVVLDHVTGETLDLKAASTESLAAFITNLQDFTAALREEAEVVSAELVARMDRDTTWTLRVGDWEVTAPSPEAGTTAYLWDVLEHELRVLVERGTITDVAAEKAVKRVINVTLKVPLNLELGVTAQAIKRAGSLNVAGVELPVLKADYVSAPVAAGIKALGKVPGTGAALDRAKRTVEPPARRAKVTLKTRAV